MKKSLFIISVILLGFTLSGCGHEHIYADATCTTPKTCTECGATEGESLGHIFLEATCESPEICERCNETRGNALGHNFSEPTCELPQICEKCNYIGQEALGHTTELGKCSNCNEYQGKDIVKTILEKLTYANAQADLALTVQTSGTDYYKSFLDGISYYESAKTEYESALDLCENYSDLATLKIDIQNLIDALPLTVYGSDDTSLNLYLDDLTKFFSLQAKCQLTMINVESSIQ